MSRLAGVLTHAGRLLAWLAAAVGRILAAIVGEVHWQAPAWARRTGGWLAQGGTLVAARPGRSALAAVVAAAFVVGGWQAWQAWQARPQPIKVQFSVADVPRTQIENEQKPNPLLATFDRSAAPLALVGKDVLQGISVTPAVAGTWRWADDRTLAFQPTEDWPVGTEYKVALARAMVAPQVELAAWDFTFRAPAFVATIASAEFYQDPTDPARKKAIVNINFSHPADPATLEPRIAMRMAGAATGVLGIGAEKTRFVVTYDKLKLNAYVHSEPLPIPKEDTRLDVTIDKGVAAARGGNPTAAVLTQAVKVPGLYSLAIRDVLPTVVSNDQNDPEQVLVVQASGAIPEKEMQKAVGVWLLPVFNPATPVAERTQPYAWGDAQEVTAAALKEGRKLDLKAIASERENTEVHSFKYNADVGRYLYIQVDKGVKAAGGYLLPDRAQRIVRVPPFPPELHILAQGALLALGGEKKVAVLVRDLPGVRIELGRLLPGQVQHLVSQSSGNFATPDFTGGIGADNLTERYERKVPLPNLKRGRAHYEAVDLAEYLKKDGEDRRGIFLLTVQGYDPAKEQKAAGAPPGAGDEESDDEGHDSADGDSENANADPESRVDRRLILVTDLGLLVKREVDGTQVVFVQSIATGLPVPGATVDVIARNGTTLFSQATDAQGMTRFPKLDGLARERAALLYLVRKGGDSSFLPLNRSDRNLDLSRFDVGGVANARTADQLSAYLFSDRGIYRPGDTMHIGLIVKAADWMRAGTRSLAGLPLEAEVLDARGLTVRRERIKLAGGGFNEIAHTTLETSPTGTYAVNLYVVKDGKAGQQIGSTSVRVQEFEPDRMKVTAHLSTEVAEGWVHPHDLSARVNVQNLFGTPAENRRVETTLTLSPAFPAFKSLADYTFYDPQRAKEGYSEKLSDGKTDAKGDVEIPLGLEKYARATYRLHVLARAFEPEGGRSVAAEVATLVSELPFLVGYKADGALDYVARGAKRSVNLIAIDPRAKRTAAGDLVLRRIERKFVSVLTKQDSGVYKYESRKKEVVLDETPLAIPAAGTTLALASDAPGNFAYVVRNADGLELNRVEYSVAGQGNVTRSLERNAELQLTLDRKDYAPGEDIEVSIQAPYVGAGLITIERDKVYAQQWFKATTLASVQKIRVPKDFEGNGYITVQFVRDPSSDEIYMSPLSYGVVPFATSLGQRSHTLKLTTPDLVKPGQQVKFRLASGEATRAVVFAVDEGILQVARYQNPDPLGFFFRKRSLDVRTAQILDLILPEFRKLMAAAAPGGDAEGALGRHLNPFKRRHDPPVAYWSGLVDVNGEREFTWRVPESFNGTLRVIAVAVNDNRMGATAAKTLVRGDFVLSPNLPLMVAPGDEFDVSVGVANNVAGSGKEAAIDVALKLPPALQVVGAATQSLKIAEMREGVALFRLKARDAADAQLGSVPVTFTATLGSRSATLSTDVSVRPATPYYTQLNVGSFRGSVDVPVQRDLHAEHRRLEAAASPLPLVAAYGLSAYLANFAHACTEQLVSQAMPIVVLGKRPEFAPLPGNNARGRTLEEALRVLRTRQNAEGGFGLWAASVKADEFASVYAVHLLLEARDHGDAVPPDMVATGLDYLQQLGASPAQDLRGARTRAYAAYLLTRQGIVTTPMLTGLREMLETKYPKLWQDDLVAAYLAASYQMQKQERVAESLIDRPAQLLAKRGQSFRYENYYDPLVRDAQTLYLLSRHFPQRAKALPPEAMLAMMKPVADNQFNTLSAAYVILALDAYANAVGAQAMGKLTIAEIDAAGKLHELALPDNLLPRVAFAPGTAKLKLGIDANLTGYYAITESGFDRQPPAGELRNGLEILREYVDAAGKPVTAVKIGDEVVVRLRFRALNRDFLPNLALVDLLPGGFEPVLQSQALDAQSEAAAPGWVNRLGRGGNWTAEYADIRDDRVVLYGTATRDMAEYSYRIKATNSGSFTVPPAYGESLYERSAQARSKAGSIVVEKAGK